MTIRGVGKPVPSQLYLMQLTGLVVEGFAKVHNPSEAQVTRSKEEGHRKLCRMTGRDFGYDVERWYEYLILSDYGMTYHGGYGAMRRFLKKAGYQAPFKKEVLARRSAEQATAPPKPASDGSS
jgi:hypothetical protein